MRKNRKKRIITPCMRKRALWGERIVWFLVVFFTAVILFVSFMKSAADDSQNILSESLKQLGLSESLNVWLFYLLFGIFGLCVAVWIFINVLKKRLPKYPVRDAEYLKQTLFSDNPNLPAVSKNNLIKKVVGDKRVDSKYRKMITGYIDNNLKPIIEFLGSKNENVLVIKSAWGTGKTTSLLVAIDEFDKKESQRDNYRYIYESAFKYASGLTEYFRDMLEALRQTLEIEGVKIADETKDLSTNLDANLPKTVLKEALSENRALTLSSDMIYEINSKVTSKKIDIKIVIILDDVDRLSGEEIVRVLAFLSTLRRLAFVKIILPIDSEAVTSQLENVVYEPKTFIQKYFPDQTSFRLKTDFEMTEQAALAIIREKSGLKNASIDKIAPIWEATILYMISQRIRAELDRTMNYELFWLHGNKTKQKESGMDWLHGVTLTILNAPHFMWKRTNHFDFGGPTSQEYTWAVVGATNIRQFQHIIYELRRIKGNALVRENFSEEDYRKIVVSWVRDYLKSNWFLLGFSLRDIINTIRGEAPTELLRKPGETFVNAFNKYFPQSPLKYEEDENRK